jgi:hypothetical protein
MQDVREHLKTGGVVTVFLGKGYDLPTDFVFHPQVRHVETRTIAARDVPGAITSNTKVAIVTDEIEQNTYFNIQQELKKRRILYLTRRGAGALEQALRQIFPANAGGKPAVFSDPADKAAPPITAQDPAAPRTLAHPVSTPPAPEAPARSGNGADKEKETRTLAPRGAAAALMDKYWEQIKGLGTADAARFLFQRKDFPSTVASLENAVRQRKRLEGRSDQPQSIVPTDMKMLKILDDAIAGLQLVREYVATAEDRIAEADSMKKRLADALGVRLS